jgi:predicted enzyme related to lactoylglutathione lyase
VHFEIPSDDIERSKRFYNKLSGRSRKGMEYWMVSTVDDKWNKTLTGGMMKRQRPG